MRLRASNSVTTLLRDIRKRGIGGTLAFAVSFVADLVFDARFGTDTVFRVPIEDLKIDSAYRARAVGYQPTQGLPLAKLLRMLAIPRNAVFLDVGSGKGKVLLLAVRYGFETVRGVDFSPELCRIAEENWGRYRRRSGSTACLQIIESCATEYEFTDESVIYLFNPFDGLVFERVLQKLISSLHRQPRRTWIIYRNPIHRDRVERLEGIRLVDEVRVWGSDFIVYTLGGEAEPVASENRSD